ncbi:MAG: hypothetical protein JSR64_07895 [Nitrospira sp.]|nr:hypothetical protein [Nitrospira sp.]MBS0173941.1 hypothetical protein [Nitrospira sp.]MBX3336613.1 hypothetical protein [Nitrospira sp.]MCW5778196.1 hypothetical protein [Nitrospira sp.]HMZ56495.1 hypothetical protein [Nitrospira sp.]
MNDLLCIMHTSRRSGWASRLLIVMACLLIGVRLVGGFICNTCYLDFEQPKSRSFHLHGGGDREPCHHGQPEASPLIQWACTVMQDESAFVLPDIPRLPVVISRFVALGLLLISYRTLFPIAAHGRGPPAGLF